MERKEFLEKVLAYGRQAGFADCEVYYRGGKAFDVNWSGDSTVR